MMYIILTYDIRAPRVGRVGKTAKKYLRPVQRSVFEGFLSEGKLERLKAELKALVDCDEDAVRIYKLQNLQGAQVDELGLRQEPLERIL